MAVNPNFTNANATTPYATGSGGLNPTFNNVSINQGGSITMGSSVIAGTGLNWNKDLSGNLSMTQTMAYFGFPINQPASLTLFNIDQSALADNQGFGDVIVAGRGANMVGNLSAINIGNAGTGVLGIRNVLRSDGSINATYAQLLPTSWTLNGVSTINAGGNTADAAALLSSLKSVYPSNFL